MSLELLVGIVAIDHANENIRKRKAAKKAAKQKAAKDRREARKALREKQLKQRRSRSDGRQ